MDFERFKHNKIHCPRCGQAFHVDPSNQDHLLRGSSLSAESSVSEFVCTLCQHKFERIYDFQRRTFVRPQSDVPMLTDEMTKADSSVVLNQLKNRWQDVLEDFNSSHAHKDFIETCQQLGHLDFAAERYFTLKQALGDDPEVDKRIRQIELKLLEAKAIKSRVEQEVSDLPRVKRQGMALLLAIFFIIIGSLKASWHGLSLFGVFIFSWLLLNRIQK